MQKIQRICGGNYRFLHNASKFHFPYSVKVFEKLDISEQRGVEMCPGLEFSFALARSLCAPVYNDCNIKLKFFIVWFETVGGAIHK
jgi:hypothetical protein